MRHALSLAWRGVGSVSPNPSVGCVLVKDNRIIGSGYHAMYGGPHAEIAALNDAEKCGEKDNIKGATAYVTLEPCSHFGKTPPCSQRLIKEGIICVVAGTEDSNPKVKGNGFNILREAGIEVVAPCLEKECKWLNRGFFRYHTLKRPWVTLKAAVSLDGKMALAHEVKNIFTDSTGQAAPNSTSLRAITGKKAQSWTHLMRAEHDGILVGIGTVLADNPELTTRHTCGKSPLRIVLDTNLLIPASASILKGGCLVLTCNNDVSKKKTLENAGAEVCVVPHNNSGHVNLVDLNAALSVIAERGVQKLMVEGGSQILSAFMKAELCDSFAFFTATSIMGEGPGLGNGLSFKFMENIIKFKDTRVRRVGEDLLIEGIFQCSPAL